MLRKTQKDMRFKQNELLWRQIPIQKVGEHSQQLKKKLLILEKMKSLPRGLGIAILVGMLAGLTLGFFANSQTNHEQLIFHDGPSISIVTEKLDFELGEQIKIRIINSGNVPLTFSDTSYGLKVTGLDGILYYLPMSSQVISTLEPMEEKIFVWDQKKLDGSDSLEGRYKIVVEGFDHENNKVKNSTVINVLK